jgi:putative Mg2+ transporter-C (MgtC) family protein
MTTTLGWGDIFWRLALTFLAGAAIGINREEHVRPAGLRTTLLVCLAASVSMIQVNALLTLVGKHPDSFIVMDLMRLPLGILSGMGFIGGGAILRKGDMVRGVTTAATLWFVTVMGLCFGGGQIGLGFATLVLGLVVLDGLKRIEKHWKQEHRGALTISIGSDGPEEKEIAGILEQHGRKAVSWTVNYAKETQTRDFSCEVRWRAKPGKAETPEFVKVLAERSGVKTVGWKPS